MHRSLIAFAIAALLGFAFSTPLHAAEDFRSSIKAGESHRKDKKFAEALVEFNAAYELAESDTDRVIALAKKGHTYAYDFQDFPAAREAVDEALTMDQAHPVGRVSALRVLAYCQMKADDDHDAATTTLEEALSLEGVEWAHPQLYLMVGDCYRFTGRLDDAIAAYQAVADISTVPAGMKAVAYLNMGITQQYNLRDSVAAKASYAKAVEANPNLKASVDRHLAKM